MSPLIALRVQGGVEESCIQSSLGGCDPTTRAECLQHLAKRPALFDSERSCWHCSALQHPYSTMTGLGTWIYGRVNDAQVIISVLQFMLTSVFRQLPTLDG